MTPPRWRIGQPAGALGSWHDAQAWCDWLNQTLVSSRRAPAVRSPGWYAKRAGGLPCRANSSGRKRARRLERQCFSFAGQPIRIARTISIHGSAIRRGRVLCRQWLRSRRQRRERTRSVYSIPADATDPKHEDLKAADDVERVVRGTQLETSPAAPPLLVSP
jgi:hypothetical protein